MRGSPLSNIMFFPQKTSDEKLILKAIILQNQSVSYLISTNKNTPQKESEIFFLKNLLGDYSLPQQAVLGL